MNNGDLYYVLDENNQPIPEPDLIKWSNYVLSGKNMLKRTHFKRESDGQEILVTTSFTGLTNIPGECYQCFETVLECERGNGARLLSNTYDQAMNKHEILVESSREPKNINDAATRSNIEYMLNEREQIREAKNWRENKRDEIL